MAETMNEIKNSWNTYKGYLVRDARIIEELNTEFISIYDQMKDHKNINSLVNNLSACVLYAAKECPKYQVALLKFHEMVLSYYDYGDDDKNDYLDDLNGYYIDELKCLLNMIEDEIEDLGGRND